jgi:hypothetical protein
MPKLLLIVGLLACIAIFGYFGQRGLRAGVFKTRYDGDIRRDSSPIAYWFCASLFGVAVAGCAYMIYLVLIGALQVA